MTDFNKEADLLILYLDYCNEIRFNNLMLNFNLKWKFLPYYWTTPCWDQLKFNEWKNIHNIVVEQMKLVAGEEYVVMQGRRIGQTAIKNYLHFTPPYRKEFVPEVYIKPTKKTFSCDAVTVDISKVNSAYSKFNQRKTSPSIEDICGKLINWDKRKKLKLVPFEGVDHIVLVPENNANKKEIDRFSLGLANLRKELNIKLGLPEAHMKDEIGLNEDLELYNSYLYRDRLEIAKEQLITYAVQSKELSANDFDIIRRFVHLLLKTKALWKKIKSLVS